MNSKNTYPVPTVFFVGIVASAVTALISSILYGIAYHTSYDTVIRHFNTGSIIVNVFSVLMLLTAVTFTFTALLMRKKFKIEEKAPGSAETFALWLCGLMFLIFGVFFLSSGSAGETDGIGALCTKVLSPLACISAVPFFLRALGRTKNTLYAVLTFAPILWGISLLFKYYFDLKEMPLNDPELTLTMVSISCAVIFFLCESRTAIGISSPAVSVFSAASTLCLTGCISAARLVLWRLDGHVIPAPTETLLLFAVAVLAGCRLYELSTAFAPVGQEGTHSEIVQSEITSDETAEDTAE